MYLQHVKVYTYIKQLRGCPQYATGCTSNIPLHVLQGAVPDHSVQPGTLLTTLRTNTVYIFMTVPTALSNSQLQDWAASQPTSAFIAVTISGTTELYLCFRQSQTLYCFISVFISDFTQCRCASATKCC
jgi:hypothetical protein